MEIFSSLPFSVLYHLHFFWSSCYFIFGSSDSQCHYGKLSFCSIVCTLTEAGKTNFRSVLLVLYFLFYFCSFVSNIWYLMLHFSVVLYKNCFSVPSLALCPKRVTDYRFMADYRFMTSSKLLHRYFHQFDPNADRFKDWIHSWNSHMTASLKFTTSGLDKKINGIFDNIVSNFNCSKNCM